MLKEGMLNFLKPAGMTSHDAVSLLRRLTGVKRVGHTGTLDPMAAGVLPLGIGGATRITEYLDLDEKEYRCEMLLGLTTDTLDIWGRLEEDRRSKAANLKEQDVIEVLETMKGNIMQLPPRYSALKVKGKRLYEYARKGEAVEIAKRPSAITRLQVIDLDLKRGRVCFDISCSKGTYIRSVCRDAGQALGCGAAMSFLLRTKSGSAEIGHAFTVEELRESGDEIWNFVTPMDRYLSFLGRLNLREGREGWFCNGGYLTGRDAMVQRKPFSQQRSQGAEAFEARVSHLKIGEKLQNCYLVYGGGRFLGTAVYAADQEKYVCDKVFYR